MKKMLRKTMTLALSAVLAMQVFAVGASAELFIDNPVVTDGKTSVKVANYADAAQKVRLYTASYEDGKLTNVAASETVELAEGNGAELVTNAEGVNYFWSDALVPYDENAVALPAPTGMTAPASRDSADNHRTYAYNSFLLEWDLDTTGVVDHYEVYEGETKIGETENGYYIVYTDDVNEDSKNYSVKAVTAGGKESAVSTAVEAGTLYMNEIDFSSMTGVAEETSLSVTYPNYANESYTAEAPKYATTEDVKETAKWLGARETTPSNGIKTVGMSVFAGNWGTDQYAAPAYVAADETVGREARGAFKTYYANKTSSNNDTGANPYMYFSLNNDYLKINDELQANVTLAYDYLDNGTQKFTGRTAKTSGGGYVGNDIELKDSQTWLTNERAITDYNLVVDTRWSIGSQPAHIRIFSNATVGVDDSNKVASSSKQYISGVRAWLTDRMTDLTATDKRQMVYGEFDNTTDVTDGITVVSVSNTQKRNGTPGEGTGCCWMTKTKETDEIGFKVEDTYLGAYDKEVTVSIDYYCGANGATEATKAVLTYDKGTDADGTAEVDLVYNKWTTVTFKLSDAGFANGVSAENCDFTLKLNGGFYTKEDSTVTGPQLYVKNIRVHASNNVK